MNKNTKNSIVVSVVIPCYNQAHFLHEAIESVLNQSYRHFEIIVVDDGSPDNAADVAAIYPNVYCVRQHNQGLPGARNSGYRVSRGDYLLFLDSDDRLLPNALEVGVDSLGTNLEYGYVTSQFNLIGFDGSPLPKLQVNCSTSPEEHYLSLLRYDHTWTPLVVMFRRTAFESVGGYSTSNSIKGCEDYDICLRIALMLPVYCHNEITAEYRVHGSGMSRNLGMMWKNTLSVIRAHRQIVKDNKRYEEAYNSGIGRIQEYFSNQIVEEIRSDLHGRHHWKSILDNILLLTFYHPRSLAKHFCRKLYRIVWSP